MTKMSDYAQGYQDAMKDCTAAYMKGGADALILWVQENNIALHDNVVPVAPREYPADYCLADVGAYGACILFPNHEGAHRDANGYSFTGTDRKVRS